MKCRKRRYRDEIGAKLALSDIGRRHKQDRIKHETRAYRCPGCRGWHLTSSPLKEHS